MKNFIVFEGVDGSGKGTQINLLKQYLESNDIPAVFTREPGGGKISEQIRSVIKDIDNQAMTDLCELLLFSAARNQHLNDIILPNKDKLVICDRFTQSTIAYQGFGRGIDLKEIEKINAIATQGITPDCVVFLDVEANAGEKRNSALADKMDRIEKAGSAFMQKVYLGYQYQIKHNPDLFLVIDGNQPPQKVFEQILKGLKERGIIK